MLHLVPIRLLLTVFGLAAMAAYGSALQVGFVSNDTWPNLIVGVFKVATPVALAAMAAMVLIWRWSPASLQRLLFPYLGGDWVGEIEFLKGTVLVQHPATLVVTHTPTTIRFVLSTKESTSETLVVHARKTPELTDLVKLVYIYEVERREGYLGAGDRYRGCAFIDVQLAKPYAMTGSYMAGSGRSGSIRMTRRNATPLWKVWR